MSREAMQMALDALEGCYLMFYEDEGVAEAISSLKAALAKPGLDLITNTKRI